MTLTPAPRYTQHIGMTEGEHTVRRTLVATAYFLMLLTLWALSHRYRAFRSDGELYAVQAMAKVHPWLAADLYLQNTSQDAFTIFSRIYVAFIKVLGLEVAGLTLFSLCTVGLLTAAWYLVRRLFSADQAWFSVAFLVVTAGTYGGYLIFSYSDNYLTARSLGEALTLTAIVVHFHGKPRIALLIGILALFIHPLMALPGILLLICLRLPVRLALILAAAGVLATLAFALTAVTLSISTGIAQIMDPVWLDVVRERSQHLFLQYWTITDWEIAARPFVCLTLTGLVVPDPRIRALCLSAMLVGACGLAIAAIAGTIGPVALLLQGQAWRWMWLTAILSVSMLAPTVAHVWRDARCGPPCAVLLVLGWTYSEINGLACVSAALGLWLARPTISDATAKHLKLAAMAGSALVLIWMLANCWTYVHMTTQYPGGEPLVLEHAREIFAMGISGLVFTWLVWRGVGKLRSVWQISLVCAVLLAAAAWILPSSVRQLIPVGSEAQMQQFADWRQAIPPSSTVLLLPSSKIAAFVWFTLDRPSYSTVSQSAGVVFSRATSLEVRRRSEVLLPLGEPDWKIFTAIKRAGSPGAATASSQSPRAVATPLTSDILVKICGDSALDFVIAQQNVGFGGFRHTHPGIYQNWYLYDCARVRSSVPAA
jgi:hypothetical protein